MEILVVPYNNVFEVKCVNIHRQSQMTLQARHFNPNYELIAVSEGPLYLQVEDEKLTLNVGDTILLLPWQQHRFWQPNVANGEFFWVQFQCSSRLASLPSEQVNWEQYLQTVRTNLLQLDQTRVTNALLLPKSIHVPQKFKLLSLFEQLMAELNDTQGNFLFRASLLLGSILELTSTALLQLKSAENTASKSHSVFCKTVLYLNNNYMKNINKELLERYLQRNYEYIGQIFKRYSDITLVEYIQILRIQRAKYLLQHTGKSIKEISDEVGFKDNFYFSKVFKKIVGKQPSQYRLELSG